MEKEISIIVPIHNSAKYIGDCIESVLGQTYTDFEFLLIDDGSKDRSGELCRKAAVKDSRIRVLRQRHKGVSAARNAGISASKGEYLFFLDSDDAIHPELLENFHNILKNTPSPDIITERFCYVEDCKFQKQIKIAKYSNIGTESLYAENKKALKWFHFGEHAAQLHSIGGKMIRRAIIENLRFDKRLVSGEDTLFIYQLLLSGATAAFLESEGYYYRKHENNSSEKCSVNTCRSRYSVCKYICSCEQKNGRIEYAKRWETFKANCIINWYLEGEQKNSILLKLYSKKLARAEVEEKLFQEVANYTRKKLFKTFSFRDNG